ncbi:MAG TPA: polysaccharide pyruvyl transferase family protein [Pseudomonadales bacterium]
MSQSIKLYWSRSKPNFGDWLSPLICEALSGRRVEYAPIARCDLVAVGSLFERLPEGPFRRRLDVWGTGAIESHRPRRSRHRFHALRGPLTAGLITNHRVTVFGDPGLLAPLLVPERPLPKRHRLGIVPHYKDAGLPAVAELAAHFRGSTVIDVFEEPVAVLKHIASCDCIVSSSLHGLVTAHALGVPGLWLMVSESVRGAGWKFRDYYAALGVTDPKAYSPRELLGSTLEDLQDRAGRPEVEAVREALTGSFPLRR